MAGWPSRPLLQHGDPAAVLRGRVCGEHAHDAAADDEVEQLAPRLGAGQGTVPSVIGFVIHEIVRTAQTPSQAHAKTPPGLNRTTNDAIGLDKPGWEPWMAIAQPTPPRPAASHADAPASGKQLIHHPASGVPVLTGSRWAYRLTTGVEQPVIRPEKHGGAPGVNAG